MAPPSCSLTTDILLHVFFHLDPLSIVRCAAVSKYWRRAVIDNASQVRRHPGRQADRRLLLGFHYRETYPGMLRFRARSTWSPSSRAHWSDDLPIPSFVPAAAITTHGGLPERMYAELTCADGLLLVYRGIPGEVSVYNPLTGFHETMPRFDTQFTDNYLLHSVHGDEMNSSPNSFQVLAVQVEYNGALALQNYSSETGAWGPVIRPLADKVMMPEVIRPYPVKGIECQGAIHWLCHSQSSLERHNKITHTVSVDISTGHAWMTRLPMQCLMSNDNVSNNKMLVLATAADGRLVLLRREDACMKVTIWVHAEDDNGRGTRGSDDGEASWALSRSFDVRKLIEHAGLSHFRLKCKDWADLEVRLEWFCRRSRCVVIWIPYLGLFVLDLKSMHIQRAAGDSQTHLIPSRYILHSVHGVETSHNSFQFQVLAMDVEEPNDGLALQNYCSEAGVWSPIIHPVADELRLPDTYMYCAAPVVCQGAIHLLCTTVQRTLQGDCALIRRPNGRMVEITHIVAVDIETTCSAWMIRLPTQCTMSNLNISTEKMLMLATTEDGRLALLRREHASMNVSIWVYNGLVSGGDNDGEASWVLSRSFDVQKLIEDAGLSHFRLECKDWVELKVRLEWFCPRSQSLIMWVPYLGLFVLES
uniref:F-box domain-containing protein n=1 Tax=Leersia perrieri TaxID=77586 RepID=A0A0D9VXY7_9ORYZ